MAIAYSNLYEKISTYENLFLAFKKAARGKRGLPSVAEFAFDEDDNLFQLQEELQSKTYQPGPYHSFYIRDPKRRLVSAAPFRDRVVHHALCNVIEPIFERTFIGDSYANRIVSEIGKLLGGWIKKLVAPASPPGTVERNKT